jgi:hypothetical protein
MCTGKFHREILAGFAMKWPTRYQALEKEAFHPRSPLVKNLQICDY